MKINSKGFKGLHVGLKQLIKTCKKQGEILLEMSIGYSSLKRTSISDSAVDEVMWMGKISGGLTLRDCRN